MNFTELVAQRHSQRSYDIQRPVDRALLEDLLDTARQAPSAHNNRPWTFLVVESTQGRKAVADAYRGEWLKSAPTIVAVKGKRSEAWVRGYDGYNALETDLTIVMDHFILAATEKGLGTCWIAAFDPEALKKALGLTDDETVFAITPLGYAPAGYQRPPTPPRKSLDEVVRYL